MGSLVLGACCLLLAACCLLLGAWCLVLAAWCMVIAAWTQHKKSESPQATRSSLTANLPTIRFS
ncbi:hypothetical protein B1748_19240 [Paenibacillus sp. MY03]|nr:hypothetical protein B1748_19240 [Paenibacillus sp. MY03]